MKSCFGLTLVVLVLLAVVGSAGLIWYMGANAEFSRKPPPAVSTPTPAPAVEQRSGSVDPSLPSRPPAVVPE